MAYESLGLLIHISLTITLRACCDKGLYIIIDCIQIQISADGGNINWALLQTTAPTQIHVSKQNFLNTTMRGRHLCVKDSNDMSVPVGKCSGAHLSCERFDTYTPWRLTGFSRVQELCSRSCYDPQTKFTVGFTVIANGRSSRVYKKKLDCDDSRDCHG